MPDAPAPLPLSAAIVCRNNEATIGRTLASLRGLAAEIVALDSGSTDGTIGLLEAAGARVQRVEWQGYNRTKQLAAEACTQEWMLNIDSDESVEPDLAGSVRAALAPGSRVDDAPGAYMVNRKVWYAGGFLNHAWQPEWRVRLVRRDLFEGGASALASFAGTEPHDELVVRSVRVERLAGTLRHDTIADMPRFLAGQLRLATLGAQARHAKGESGSRSRLLLSPAGALFKQLVLRSAWRDGWRGWAAAGATACHALMKHLVLLEASRAADRRTETP
ncbi:MAG: glycosyltransferase family 2 protein [Phycisphaeraceae bacterium]|nr:glycosyltransferase family 2 protein [Phycisphaeraceae bacterium]